MLIMSPVEQFSEWNVGIPRPPDDHLGGEPGSPAEVVHHQHEHQHLQSLLVCWGEYNLTLDKTLMILLLPLFIARAAEQAWLLLCLMQEMNLLDTKSQPFFRIKTYRNCLQEQNLEEFSEFFRLVICILSRPAACRVSLSACLCCPEST